MLLSERKLMQKDIDAFVEDRHIMQKDIDMLLHDRKLMEKDIKQFIFNEKTIKKQNGILAARVLKLKEELESSKPYNPEGVDEYGVYIPSTDYPLESGEGEFGVAIDPALAYHASSENLTESRKNRQFITESRNKQRNIKSEIVAFFEREVKKYPALYNIKEKIINSSDLIIATRVVDEYISSEKERPVFTESRRSFINNSNDDWLGDRY
jgi:hypothetical protein